MLALPNDYLYADDLIKAIKTMHEKQMYKKFLLSIEFVSLVLYSNVNFLKM